MAAARGSLLSNAAAIVVVNIALSLLIAHPCSALLKQSRPELIHPRINAAPPLRPDAFPQLRPSTVLDRKACAIDSQRPAAGATIEHLRGGAGLAKKMGGKNLGLLLILLSLLYLPRAMSFCVARFDPRSNKIVGLGCGSSLPVANVVTLAGIGLVLANSRQFDRHGRSKFKMRLTGSVIIVLGMFLVFAHAEAAHLSWYSKTNAYIGLILEWWGFVSLFYNFTPRLVAQLPREISKAVHKMLAKGGLAKPEQNTKADADARQRELDRLNRWAQANQ